MHIKNSTHRELFRWRPACWLRVTGEDAATFLQGQFTNDLRPIESGGAVYGLWLSVKGKVVADSFVVRRPKEEAFWIGSYFSPAAIIRERLEHFIIADDVVVEDQTADVASLSLLGLEEDAVLPQHADGGWMFPGRRIRGPNREIVFRIADGEPPWVGGLGAVELSEEEMERRRIEAGIPAVPRDAGPGDLPNEAGLEIEAISYIKGCYLGQEVMARLKSMGQVRRRLFRVRGSHAPASLPAPVFKEERQVGELRSAAKTKDGWIGLAMVSLLHIEPGARLSFAPNAAPELRLEPSS